MTTRTLDELASRTRFLLLDFDGPTCDVFAGLPAPVVAKRLLALVGDPAIADRLADNDDPMQVLRAVGKLDPSRWCG